jgi:hypothetical protein
MKHKAKAAASNDATRKRISDTLKKKWEDPEFRSLMLEKIKTRKSQAGNTTDDSHRKKISEAMRKKWKDPSYRKAAIGGMAKKRGMTLEEYEESRQKSTELRKTRRLTPLRKPKIKPFVAETATAKEIVKRGVSVVRQVEPMKAKQVRKVSANGMSRTATPRKSTVSARKGTKTTTGKGAKVKRKVSKKSKASSLSKTQKETIVAVQPMTRAPQKEEDRIALIRTSNPELYSLLYGDDGGEVEEEVRQDFCVSVLFRFICYASHSVGKYISIRNCLRYRPHHNRQHRC